MSWHDLVFLGGSLLTVVALLPTLRDLDARIPLATSVPKFALAVIYTGTFYSLGMTFSAIGLLGTAVMWSLVVRYRSPTGRYLPTDQSEPPIDGATVAEPSQRLGTDGDRL
ncbi:hypothetical protein HTZ84_08765 [Haloterrigena sp. SYSU A558-1]|uniref:Uncharacterized protein n=1 Tax=Haloterrigena gelatinilytica TaxID=2741724 RepID=A0ABX2L805_9EURY|nr:hypothetical protein [Haloterrigena gelatinilytica]NUC72400.1 hypothetical protein [Haloterrigena gelatinilytica]